MSSLWIRTRRCKSGVRFSVLYRVGGRDTRIQTAGTFKTLPDAEDARNVVARSLAVATLPPPPESARVQSVYVARFSQRIKIGVSVDPVARCRDLHADLLVVLEGGRQLERQLHERFAHRRIRGEWFQDCAELAEFIADARRHARRAARLASQTKEKGPFAA